MEIESRRWFPVSVNGSQFHAWDDDDLLVVYHRSSGDTHMLEALPGVVLELVEAACCTAEQLYLELSDIFQGDDKNHALEVIEASLLQLRGVGLVHNTPN